MIYHTFFRAFLTASIWMLITSMFLPVFAQTLPEGERIRVLADRAGMLIGVRASLRNAEHETVVEREFNTSTATWYPRWGAVDYNDFNRVMNWLYEREMLPIHHMLFGPNQYDLDRAIATPASELEQVLKDRIRGIMESNDNGSKAHVWNLVNEVFQWSWNSGSYWGESDCVWVKLGMEQDLSGLTGDNKVNDTHPKFIGMAYKYASQLTDGKLELRDNTIEFSSKKSLAFYQLVKHLLNSQVPLDAIGMQCHFKLTEEFKEQELRAEIRKYRNLGLEVYFTEVDFQRDGQEWSDEWARVQKDQYQKLIKVALEEGVSQVHFWGLHDTEDAGWLTDQNPLLFDEHLNPKPAYYGVQQALSDYLEKTHTKEFLNRNPGQGIEHLFDEVNCYSIDGRKIDLTIPGTSILLRNIR